MQSDDPRIVQLLQELAGHEMTVVCDRDVAQIYRCANPAQGRIKERRT